MDSPCSLLERTRELQAADLEGEGKRNEEEDEVVVWVKANHLISEESLGMALAPHLA